MRLFARFDLFDRGADLAILIFYFPCSHGHDHEFSRVHSIPMLKANVLGVAETCLFFIMNYAKGLECAQIDKGEAMAEIEKAWYYFSLEHGL